MAVAAVTKYKYLFTPVKIGPLTLKNRIVVAGNWNQYWDENGLPTETTLNHYRERAAGGAALVYTCAGTASNHQDFYPCMQENWGNEAIVEAMKPLVAAIHQYDCYAGAGVSFPGHHRQTYVARNLDFPAFGCIQTSCGYEGDRIAKEAEIHEIREIEDEFARAAERVKRAGFDSVEMLLGHGKMTQQFLEPHFNKRTDEYGGSLENRMRFNINIARKVREAVGKDFCFGFKMDTFSGHPEGISTEELIEAAKMLESYLDYFATTIGWYETWGLQSPNQYSELEPGWENVFVRKLKAVAKIPVLLGGHINEPGLADRFLAEGACDAITIARGLLADPDYPKKALEGREEDIRPCIRCVEGCGYRMFHPMIGGTRCQVNPACGEEGRWGSWTVTTAPSRRGVLIVGAGPGGLECARNAAERGHEVVVYEKADVPGGQMLMWSMLPHRSETKLWIDWAERQCSKLGVKINYNSEINAGNIDDILAKENPDDIVVATGAHADRTGMFGITVAAIPGWDKPHVFTYEDVINGVEIPGKTALVYDLLHESIIPLGVAEMLAEQGKKVHIVTPWPEVSTMFMFYTAGMNFVKPKQYELGITQQVEYLIAQITDKGVILVPLWYPVPAVASEYQCDAIVLASERRSNREIYDLLKDRGIRCVHTIGDALQPRRLVNATRDGMRVGREEIGQIRQRTVGSEPVEWAEVK